MIYEIASVAVVAAGHFYKRAGCKSKGKAGGLDKLMHIQKIKFCMQELPQQHTPKDTHSNTHTAYIVHICLLQHGADTKAQYEQLCVYFSART